MLFECDSWLFGWEKSILWCLVENKIRRMDVGWFSWKLKIGLGILVGGFGCLMVRNVVLNVN